MRPLISIHPRIFGKSLIRPALSLTPQLSCSNTKYDAAILGEPFCNGTRGAAIKFNIRTQDDFKNVEWASRVHERLGSFRMSSEREVKKVYESEFLWQPGKGGREKGIEEEETRTHTAGEGDRWLDKGSADCWNV